MVWKAICTVLALIPGLGHIAIGRCFRGVLLFFGFTFFVNGFIIAPFLWHGDGFGRDISVALACAGSVYWLYATLDFFRIAYWRGLQSVRDSKRRLFLDALTHYLRNDLAAARRELRSILRLDSDDADAYFHLAMTYKAMGARWRARRCLALCRTKDANGKWLHQIREELTDLRRRKRRPASGVSGHGASGSADRSS
ncbi:MAG: hypothetical protein HYY93_01130 [Planctomycetes bacterium]|nr:hypothetical protein [Planctomycetota bacterium]